MLRIRLVIVTSLVVAVSSSLLFSSPAQGACQTWDVSGNFTVDQSNGYHPEFSLIQNGSQLGGTAKDYRVLAGTPPTTGNITGTINGSQFHVVVTWTNNTIGDYTGTIDGGGHLAGNTYDKVNPHSTATWSSNRTFGCQPAVPPPAHPTISVDTPSPNKFVISGTGFVGGATVHIRVTDANYKQLWFDVTATSDGRISKTFDALCALPGNLSFSANDGRPDPQAQDGTGTLWSNTVQATCVYSTKASTVKRSSISPAIAKKAETKAETSKAIGMVGSVTGTLSWPKGAIFVPSSKIAAPGIKSPTLQDQINLHGYTVNVTPGSAGSFGTTQRSQVGSAPTYGRVSVVGTVASVQYTVTGLPTGVTIEIDAKPKTGGTFTHSGSPNFTCTLGAPAVSHWDLHYDFGPR